MNKSFRGSKLVLKIPKHDEQMKKAISEEYKQLIVKPGQIIELSQIIYEPWRRDLEIAKRKWRNDRLPEVEKKIDEHNKDVKANKSTYSFNTYLPISEQDKEAIIEKEKNFFIFTSQRAYEFLSKFTVQIGRKTIENTSPDFLEKLDLEKACEIEFSAKSTNGNKSVQLEILTGNSWGEKLKYRIEGSDDRWINSTEEDIKGVINNIQKPHDFTRYKSWIAIISAFVLSVTFYKILIKLSLLNFLANIMPDFGLKLLYAIVSILFFIFLTIKILRKINPLFPNFAIKANYNPFDSNFVKIAIFFVTAILSPLFWGLAQLLFIK